jgi:membrane protease YdiL (CAAX protease family)
LILGVVTGLILSFAVVIIALIDGETLGFDPNPWMIGGNAFSNYYEELEYRGLLTVAAASAFNSRWAGVLASSLLFGWSHGGKGFPFMILVGVVGVVFGWLWIRTRSLGAPWIAHQVSDAVLDSL